MEIWKLILFGRTGVILIKNISRGDQESIMDTPLKCEEDNNLEERNLG
jgi:hypothetical protein